MRQYLDMMRHIRDNGVFKPDRTGTGTYSIFAHQMRFDLSEGFPLVTTKKCHLKSIIHELLWFLRGETNIRYLKEHGVTIWDDWVLKGTEEYVDLTVEELQEAIKKKLGVTSFGWNRADDDNIDSTWDPIGELKHATFTIAKEDYDRLDVARGPMLPIMQFTAQSLDIETKRLVAGELGPVYGCQWRDWPLAPQTTTDALIELACLGNGTRWGNSDGNRIAQKALLAVPGIRSNKKAYMTSGLEYGAWLQKTEQDPLAHVNEQGGLDQIANLVDMLKNNPNSRRLLVSAWNPAEVDQMALPPCHCLFQFYTAPMEGMGRWIYGERHGFYPTEEGRGLTGDALEAFLDEKGVPKAKLSCQLYQRSCDVFLGVPFNIASYALLTMMMAQVTGMGVGEFIWTGGDIHIYSNHLEQVDLQLSREPHPLPKMVIKQRGQGIDQFEFDDFELVDYVHDAVIKAPIAV